MDSEWPETPANFAPDMDRFAGLKLVDPVTVEILWESSRLPPHKWQGVRCSNEQAYQLYLHLAQLFYDQRWPQAEPWKSPGARPRDS